MDGKCKENATPPEAHTAREDKDAAAPPVDELAPEHVDEPQAAGTEALVVTWEGPLPPPGLLEQFDQVVPGLAKQIAEQARVEADHVRRLETAVLNTSISDRVRRQWIGMCRGLRDSCRLDVRTRSECLLGGRHRLIHRHRRGSRIHVGGFQGKGRDREVGSSPRGAWPSALLPPAGTSWDLHEGNGDTRRSRVNRRARCHHRRASPETRSPAHMEGPQGG